MYTILRLITLLSQTNSGLKQAEFDLLRRAFIMCYGYQEIATILNLQDARLIKVRDRKFDWSKIKSEFNIINEGGDDGQQAERSIHYVYGGMAPISVSVLKKMFDAGGFNAIAKGKCTQSSCVYRLISRFCTDLRLLPGETMPTSESKD